jgi:hypothetical protein
METMTDLSEMYYEGPNGRVKIDTLSKQELLAVLADTADGYEHRLRLYRELSEEQIVAPRREQHQRPKGFIHWLFS